MYQLAVKPKAVEMAKEAFEWYDEQQTGLCDRFLQELESGFDKLELSPISYKKVKKNYRQLVLRTFPYVVVFEIIRKEVVIYSIFHTSQNPSKKFKKK
jgi:plasmid stabilization system protein ParE